MAFSRQAVPAEWLITCCGDAALPLLRSQQTQGNVTRSETGHTRPQPGHTIISPFPTLILLLARIHGGGRSVEASVRLCDKQPGA